MDGVKLPEKEILQHKPRLFFLHLRRRCGVVMNDGWANAWYVYFEKEEDEVSVPSFLDGVGSNQFVTKCLYLKPCFFGTC